MSKPKYLTVSQVAKALGVSRQAVHLHIKRGTLRAIFIAQQTRTLYAAERVLARDSIQGKPLTTEQRIGLQDTIRSVQKTLDRAYRA